jgi:hypothetical protein
LGNSTDYRLYNLQIFSRPFFLRCLKLSRTAGPHPLQMARVKAYIKLLGRRTASGRRVPLSLAGYHRIEMAIIRRAWSRRTAVYYIVPDRQTWPAIPRMRSIRIIKRASWRDLVIESRRRPGGFWNHATDADRTITMALYQILPTDAPK